MATKKAGTAGLKQRQPLLRRQHKVQTAEGWKRTQRKIRGTKTVRQTTK